ncbi:MULTISPECIES: hypothetical protein [unclassified Shewanella]|uniref:hypothetical protein n=1 Tax=unclassified Shewanella TaxID=196818 RepID=UPI0006D65BF3|nr:hypothetical protein [Shewanella sp. P1-14-1]KPZ68758.1 hypothetical protein AN944_03383 [Shewanella sp. P1-14-1]
MSSVIKLLERLGKDAILSESATSFEKAISESGLTPELITALNNKDVKSLVNQLDVCPEIVCALLPADEDEDESEQEESKITSLAQ